MLFYAISNDDYDDYQGGYVTVQELFQIVENRELALIFTVLNVNKNSTEDIADENDYSQVFEELVEKKQECGINFPQFYTNVAFFYQTYYPDYHSYFYPDNGEEEEKDEDE